jgi:hypothetical protein
MATILTWTKRDRHGVAPVKSYTDCETVFEARKRRAAELDCAVSEIMGRKLEA